MKFTDAAPLNDLAQLQQGWTALHHAAEKDPDGRMVERMLLAGCSPHVANHAGQTPLAVAETLGRGCNVVQMLELRGKEGLGSIESRIPVGLLAWLNSTPDTPTRLPHR